jgi:hypothetical protein
MAKIRITAPGPSSSSVGVNFLKIVSGVAIKPWGITSRIRWATKEAQATIRNFSAVSIPDFIAKTVMMQAEEMWVVVVI